MSRIEFNKIKSYLFVNVNLTLIYSENTKYLRTLLNNYVALIKKRFFGNDLRFY